MELFLVKKRLHQERGFTVLEVAISMVILSTGLLALAAVIPLMKADVQRSETRTQASFLAEETVEWLHSLQYTDELLLDGQHVDNAFAVPGFTRSWTVEDDTPIPRVKRVTVAINRNQEQVSEGASVVFLYAKAGR